MNRKNNIDFLLLMGNQLFTFLYPIITLPYVLRIFSPQQMGYYGISMAVVNIFMVLGSLGVNIYGIKVLKELDINSEEFHISYLQIRFVQVSNIIFIYSIYIIFSGLFYSEIFTVMLCQSLFILSLFFDIGWMYYALNEFKRAIIRNLMVKIVSIVIIFSFVNESSDFVNYVLLVPASTVIANISLFINHPLVKKKSIFSCFDLIKIKTIYIESIKLFTPTFLTVLNSNLDKVIMSNIGGYANLGLYDQAQKIQKLVTGVFPVVGLFVMSKTNLKNTKNENDSIIKNTFMFNLVLSVGSAFGIFSVSEEFVEAFFGPTYSESAFYLKFFAPVIVLSSINSFFQDQIAIPLNRTKVFIIPHIVYILSLIFTVIILKNEFGVISILIGVLIAELLSLVYRINKLKSDIIFLRNMKYNILTIFISGSLMYIILIKIKVYVLTISNSWSVILLITIGLLIYFPILILLNKGRWT